MSFESPVLHKLLSSEKHGVCRQVTKFSCLVNQLLFFVTKPRQFVEINYTARWNHVFTTNLDTISTQPSDSLQLRKWNKVRHRGGKSRIKMLHRSRPYLKWLNLKLVRRILLLPNNMVSSTINNSIKILDRFLTLIPLRLPQMVSASFWTSRSSLQTTTFISDTGFNYNFVFCSSMRLSW